ncbi:hypothetical protein E4T47_06422 [Aureobasidium subglaciale]|nr:hypothetical protein E4T47_06422 [Aureobasidium subglaciale]
MAPHVIPAPSAATDVTAAASVSLRTGRSISWSAMTLSTKSWARDTDSDMRSGSDVGQARFFGSSTPAAKFSDGPLIRGICDASSTEQQPLSMCQECRRQYYCSKKCQKAHWSSHKKLCLARTMS